MIFHILLPIPDKIVTYLYPSSYHPKRCFVKILIDDIIEKHPTYSVNCKRFSGKSFKGSPAVKPPWFPKKSFFLFRWRGLNHNSLFFREMRKNVHAKKLKNAQ